MMNKTILTTILVAALAASTAFAQDKKELNKEITLEKDFVPQVKKATKKNNLPQVKKVDTSGPKTTLKYSDWASPIDVPTSIPTMMPYGYRTAHIFNHKRGYFDVGGGSQANFVGSLGYRLLDSERTKLGIWLQHNSTWAGNNSSVHFPAPEKRIEQKFNDNRLQVDLAHQFEKGKLSVGLKGRIDNFNYYGGWSNLYPVSLLDNPDFTVLKEKFSPWDWSSEKQTFLHLGFDAGWEGKTAVAGHAVDYHVGLGVEHSRYDKRIDKDGDGLRENLVRAALGGETPLSEYTGAGLDVDFFYQKWSNQVDYSLVSDYIVRRIGAVPLNASLLGATSIPNHSMWMFRLSPFFKWRNDIVSLKAGLNIDLSHNDGAAVRLSPNVQLDVDAAPGFGLYAKVEGGKDITRLEDMHIITRYWTPNVAFSNPYIPLDMEVGLNVGPFAGFSMRPFVGYMMEKHGNNNCLFDYQGLSGTALGMTHGNLVIDMRGVYVGVMLNYKYRSLVDASLKLSYAPQDDDYDPSRSNFYKGAVIDRYGSDFMAGFDVRVHPIKQLTVNVGLDVHTGRGDFVQDALLLLSNIYRDIIIFPTGVYSQVDPGNIVNLKAGASYRFTNSFSVWLQASNLLNKKWDIIYGMGGQRLNVMAGVALTF